MEISLMGRWGGKESVEDEEVFDLASVGSLHRALREWHEFVS